VNYDLLDDRAAACRVPCPVERCNAQAGDPCRNVHTGLPLEHLPAHDVRLKAAGVIHAPVDSRDLRRAT
jgi:hypothetical protein